MSMEVNVFLKRADLPSRDSWQLTLRETGFPIDLDPAFDPIKDSGFIPCRLGELKTGFQYAMSPADDVASCYPDITHAVQPFDTVVTFFWGGDLNECVAALANAAALTVSSAGIMYDPQEGMLFENADALKYAHESWEQASAILSARS